MFDYLKTRDSALKLLRRFGREITVRQVTSGEYDPDTGTNSTTSNDVTALACDFAVKGETTVNGTMIVAGDRYAIVQNDAGITVTVTDKLVIDDVAWNVFASLPIAPGGVNVVNKVYIRK